MALTTAAVRLPTYFRPAKRAARPRPVAAWNPDAECPAAAPHVAALKNGLAFATAIATSALVTGWAGAITYDELQRLSYNEVRGTGLAAVCPTIDEGSTDLKALKPGNYTLQSVCLEPTKITVKEEGQTKGSGEQWSDTRLLTRQTYNLSDITADFKVGPSGAVTFKPADDGINQAPVTVQVPGGERVPFLFGLKDLEASGSLNQFGGNFSVPSYRGTSFLDPKGRGGSTGYDTAVALPASGRGDEEDLAKENLKKFGALRGTAVFSVAKVDPVTGEVAGLFESVQPSDTDMGAKAPKDVKVQGIWYGRLA